MQRVRAPTSFTISRRAAGDLVANNDCQWESRVKVHEEQSEDNVAENIKLAVLQKYLCDGELAHHLNLQSGRLTTYELTRKEAINNLQNRRGWRLALRTR